VCPRLSLNFVWAGSQQQQQQPTPRLCVSAGPSILIPPEAETREDGGSSSAASLPCGRGSAYVLLHAHEDSAY
jgi:hypothetical protein